jgi:hypothetical protein
MSKITAIGVLSKAVKGLCFMVMILLSEQHAFGQVNGKLNIDSLSRDSLVINEFKMINYCFCQDYLKMEEAKSAGVVRKSTTGINYGYLYPAAHFSSHSFEHSRSYFGKNTVELRKFDFSDLVLKYYKPIVDYLKKTSDIGVMDGYSPVFECFYTVEKMPLQSELRKFLIKNQKSIR